MQNSAGNTLAHFTVQMLLPLLPVLEIGLPRFVILENQSVPNSFSPSRLFNEPGADGGLGIFHLVDQHNWSDWMNETGLIASGKTLSQTVLPGAGGRKSGLGSQSAAAGAVRTTREQQPVGQNG
ncbi:MAG: hypothetical protein LH606_08640 [Cytophagaceae bacterium]|nr:hypothetical protein [Cytophagaceae bacterium]